MTEIFVYDFPELQRGGKLCSVMYISTPQLIGSYNNIVRDINTRNIIVIKVMKPSESVNIDDIPVAQTPGLRWNAVLKACYQHIMDSFCNNNPYRVSQNKSLRHHTLGLGR